MNTLILYLRKNWRVKNTRAAGFSILEMTIVLGIMAATSIAGIKVLNGKIEQNAVDRVVADLTLVAEAAYECYVDGFCKDAVGWKSEQEKASAYLADNQRSFLPPDFSENYEAHAQVVQGTSKLVIKAVNLPNKRIAQRVAHTFGSLAQWAGPENTVEVTLGIPGTENALSAIKKKDFIFKGIYEYDIENVKNIVTSRITIGGSEDAGGIVLRREDVETLVGLAKLGCSSGEFITKERGKPFRCGSSSGSGSDSDSDSNSNSNSNNMLQLNQLVINACSGSNARGHLCTLCLNPGG